MKNANSLKRQNYLLLIGILLIPTLALWMGGNSEFGGADTMASELIDKSEGYTPWFESVWAPPGGETESLLFALQAALGAGILCYFIGYIRGKKATANDK
ncbi:energy-coupling factor ABC transporter substrate-binding protein [Carboxylicivirga sediminis]|uniref:Cobalt transport protein CbiN n=1 Tax=Carboxylicivirga sediminis TaxID=2006564 RepID=A0A941IX22_9BACT|nr:energy-coupling factor ABC transporter substrate-binding protein [Carboxylicivirga sediminis]MBR8535138.1 energy-coupling factor ABC transporter substrate-binding protein [Carboxylicivirga sediminis]